MENRASVRICTVTGMIATAALGLVIIKTDLMPMGDFGYAELARPTARAAQIREHHLPDLLFTDHLGQPRRFYSDLVRGKVVAISFMYAACSKLCELSSQNMARLQDELGERLGRDVQLYSISLDPLNDTPETLRNYREQHGAKPGWTFLTATNPAELTLFRRKLGVYDPDPEIDGDLTQHTGMVVLGNEPTGRWSKIPALVHPIRIRQAVERVLLPPEQWPRGQQPVDEVPREDSHASEGHQPWRASEQQLRR